MEAVSLKAGDDALLGSSSRESELKNWSLQTPFFPMNNEVSFVQSSDDDDDDDKEKEGGAEGGGESHEGHEGSEKPKHEEHKAEGGAKDEKEKKHDDKGKDEKPKGNENLLTSPQEQSKFIRKSMNKAAKESVSR